MQTPVKSAVKSRILATAASLFAQSGYAGVSTRDVASAAAVNEVTIYRHYPRKRDLYMAVLETELQRVHLRGDLLSRIAQAQDARTALRRTFDLIATIAAEDPQLLRLMQFSALEIGEDIEPLLQQHLGEFIEVVARYLDHWIRKGELRCTNSKILIFNLMAIVVSHDFLHRVFAKEIANPEVMFDLYAEFCAA
jgi:AcrR family transcriptional regulator